MSAVLVTGAAAQAANGVLEAFADAGWRIAGLTRADPPAGPPGTRWVHADLTDPGATSAAIADAARALDGLDALVCLAGGFGLTPVDEASWADYEQLLDRNYRATAIATLAALPHLGEGSSIVTIGARAVLQPRPRSSGYLAAKAGVITFSASLAAELRPRGIRVNCVLPGTIDTPSNRATMPEKGRVAWVPPRRFGELVRYLASPESDPLTGSAIPIG